MATTRKRRASPTQAKARQAAGYVAELRRRLALDVPRTRQRLVGARPEWRTADSEGQGLAQVYADGLYRSLLRAELERALWTNHEEITEGLCNALGITFPRRKAPREYTSGGPQVIVKKTSDGRTVLALTGGRGALSDTERETRRQWQAEQRWAKRRAESEAAGKKVRPLPPHKEKSATLAAARRAVAAREVVTKCAEIGLPVGQCK